MSGAVKKSTGNGNKSASLWSRGPIKTFVKGIYDGPHATPKESNEGPIFLGIKNVTPEGRLDLREIRHVSEEEFGRWTKRVTPQEDDIVFSYEATLHRYAIIPKGFRGCLGRRMALVRPDETKTNPRYLHYYFLSPAWKTKVDASIITGATVDRVPLTKVPSFEINIPSLQTQQRIAEVLSAYDDLIENNYKRIDLLQQATKLLYREWFINLRFPGYDSIPITSGLPPRWRKQTLGDKITLHYGKALKEEVRQDGEVPVYGSSGIVGTHDKALVKGPAIIVGRKGNVGSVFWSDADFYPIDTVYYVSREESSYYIFHALQNMTFTSSDAAVPGLNRNYAYSRPLLVPPTELLEEFEKAVTPFYSQIRVLERQNQKLAEARDLLLPRLMSGALELKVAETPAIAVSQPKASSEKQATDAFKEAVLISVLADRFASPQFPLGRKRYTKFSYLVHRHQQDSIEAYERKAAGPYNPRTRYQGPEKIAVENGYVQETKAGQFSGFTAGPKITDVRTKYAARYIQQETLDWLDQNFRYKNNDDLELYTTVDHCLLELAANAKAFSVAHVKQIIAGNKDWKPKLDKAFFADQRIQEAITTLQTLLRYTPSATAA